MHDKNRRVIPRWRDLRSAASTGELATLRKKSQSHLLDSSEFEISLKEWNQHPSLGLAFEIVAGGMMLNRKEEAKAAARMLANAPTTSPLTRALAHIILNNHEPELEENPNHCDLIHLQRAKIAGIRQVLIDFPNNPLLWVDLARNYVLLGQLPPSIRAMNHALAIAPNNRFVLRSASRFFIHIKDPEYALALLQRSPATLRDPWLLAAHLATSEVAETKPLHIKAARDMIHSGSFSDLQISELSSALGSLELSAGNSKQGRKFIGFSLAEPTENALAQAIWLAKKTKSVNVKSDLNKTDVTKVDRAYEALARIAYLSSSWGKVVQACQEWALDEQFSSRPATLGSYIATSILDDPIVGERITNRALLANPTHTLLLNNRVVSLAYLGRLEEASRDYDKISKVETDSETKAMLLATRGLLEFRKGNPEVGRVLYRDALEVARSNKSLRALAILHLAKEELRLDQAIGSACLKEAEIEMEGETDPAKIYLLERLKAISLRD